MGNGVNVRPVCVLCGLSRSAAVDGTSPLVQALGAAFAARHAALAASVADKPGAADRL